MTSETVVLLTYLYDSKLRDHRTMRYLTLTGLPPHLPFDLYLVQPLEKIFRKVIVHDYLARISCVGLKGANREIVDLVRNEQPKYVVWTPWQYEVWESTLQAIRDGGNCLIGWFFDDEWRFGEYSKWWIPYLDICVTNDFDTIPKYLTLGARVIHTIPNTGISVKEVWDDSVGRYDVSFVGSTRYADRERYMRGLRREGIRINVFGPGSESGYVSFERMIEIFQASKVNVNFSRGWNDLRRQIKGRVFQICLAGGFVLTEYAPGLEKYFLLGKEIACFCNEAELAREIRYFLHHDRERLSIARAGWERARHDYTSSALVAKVFSEISQVPQRESRGESHCATPRPARVPAVVRVRQSRYYFRWARAFFEEGFPDSLWRESLAMAVATNRLNMSAWYYLMVGALPRRARLLLLQGYSAFDCIVRSIALMSLGRAASLRRVARRFAQWIFQS